MKKLNWIIPPAKIYFLTLLIGLVVALLFDSNTMNIKPDSFGQIYGLNKFLELFKNNAILVCIYYISLIFTTKISKIMYATNGFALGYTIGVILQSNIRLLLLIIPHGIFEIPCILATGYIIDKGEIYVRENFRRYVIILLLHICFVAFCAFIESFVTPLFLNFI